MRIKVTTLVICAGSQWAEVQVIAQSLARQRGARPTRIATTVKLKVRRSETVNSLMRRARDRALECLDVA